MSWQNVNPLDKLVQLEVGDNIEGVFKDTFEHVTKKDENVTIYNFVNQDGDVFSLMGCGSLNNLMKDVAPGTRLRIENSGLENCPNPKQPGETTKFHAYKVFRWNA